MFSLAHGAIQQQIAPDERDACSPSHQISPSQDRPAISRPVQEQLGKRLQGMYEAIIAESVPDRFVHLLNRLDEPKREDNR